MFRDRKDAGQQLGEALRPFKEQDPLILAIPRGGVEVALHAALALEADLRILVARKLPLPRNPEAGFGAIAEDGSTFVIEHVARMLNQEIVEAIVREQKEEIRRRIDVLRGGEPLPPLEGRTVILIDDGIAMGSTMRAGIAMCRRQKAGRVIAAAPVTGPSTAEEIGRIADDLVILETPANFRAVAQVYERWHDVSDDEVLQLMQEYRRAGE